MPLASFTPNQFHVHVFSSPSKRARETQPNNYIIYSFDQGKGHKQKVSSLTIVLERRLKFKMYEARLSLQNSPGIIQLFSKNRRLR